jgi:hypothetical protein
MAKKYSESKGDYIIERGGGMEIHRKFEEKYDGWINEQLDPSPVVNMAADIIEMHHEINRLRRENWTLKEQLKLWRK